MQDKQLKTRAQKPLFQTEESRIQTTISLQGRLTEWVNRLPFFSVSLGCFESRVVAGQSETLPRIVRALLFQWTPGLPVASQTWLCLSRYRNFICNITAVRSDTPHRYHVATTSPTGDQIQFELLRQLQHNSNVSSSLAITLDCSNIIKLFNLTR